MPKPDSDYTPSPPLRPYVYPHPGYWEAVQLMAKLTRQQWRTIYRVVGIRNVPRWPQPALAAHRRRRHR